SGPPSLTCTALHPPSTPSPYTTLFRSLLDHRRLGRVDHERRLDGHREQLHDGRHLLGFVTALGECHADVEHVRSRLRLFARDVRSEEHTSELQSRETLVCRLLLEKKHT